MSRRAATGWRWGNANVVHLHDLICIECGEAFEARTTQAKRCPPCRVMHEYEKAQLTADERRGHERQRVAQNMWNNRSYEVARDPSGDFAVGARFNDVEVEHGLKQGIWPEGFQFRDRRTSRLWSVVQSFPQGLQRLIPSDTIPSVSPGRCPPSSSGAGVFSGDA